MYLRYFEYNTHKYCIQQREYFAVLLVPKAPAAPENDVAISFLENNRPLKQRFPVLCAEKAVFTPDYSKNQESTLKTPNCSPRYHGRKECFNTPSRYSRRGSGPNIQHPNPAFFGEFLFRIKIVAVNRPRKNYSRKPSR
jgi:hypothetical protein